MKVFFSYPLLSPFPLCDCGKNSVGQLTVKKLNKVLSQWCSCAAFLDRATNTLTQMFTQAEGTRDKGRILTEMKARALKVTLNKKVALSNIIKLLRLVSDRSLFTSCKGGGGWSCVVIINLVAL